MRRWAGRLCVLLGVLAAAAAGPADAEDQCGPQRSDDLVPWRDGLQKFDAKALAEARAKEAKRIGDSSDVLRVQDRLFLALSSDRLASLTDCRFGDGLKIHLFEKYDEQGGFYVIATQEHEDFVHTLVMKLTGKAFRALSWPVWSPDGKRFVHGRCDKLKRYDTAQIVRPVDGDLRVEVTIDLPCESRNCAFSWESATSLSTTCHTAGQPAARDESFELVRKDGAWTVVRD